MAYVDDILEPGEQVLYRTGTHWVVFVAPAVTASLCAVLWVGAMAAGSQAAHVPLLGVLVAGTWLIVRYVEERFEEHAVTNHRVIAKRGILRRDVCITPLDRIQSIDVRQGVIGRFLNYGTVILYTAAESHGRTGRDRIRNPGEWRKQISGALEATKRPAPPSIDLTRGEPNGARSVRARLEDLEALRRDGLVSEDEYLQKRQELLEQL